MTRQRRSRMHKSIKTLSKKYRLRKRQPDLDQIHTALTLPPRKPDLELPGGGEWECRECARDFVDKFARDEHKRGQPHKRRVKLLKEPAYTQAEADGTKVVFRKEQVKEVKMKETAPVAALV